MQLQFSPETGQLLRLDAGPLQGECCCLPPNLCPCEMPPTITVALSMADRCYPAVTIDGLSADGKYIYRYSEANGSVTLFRQGDSCSYFAANATAYTREFYRFDNVVPAADACNTGGTLASSSTIHINVSADMYSGYGVSGQIAVHVHFIGIEDLSPFDGIIHDVCCRKTYTIPNQFGEPSNGTATISGLPGEKDCPCENCCRAYRLKIPPLPNCREVIVSQVKGCLWQGDIFDDFGAGYTSFSYELFKDKDGVWRIRVHVVDHYNSGGVTDHGYLTAQSSTTSDCPPASGWTGAAAPANVCCDALPDCPCNPVPCPTDCSDCAAFIGFTFSGSGHPCINNGDDIGMNLGSSPDPCEYLGTAANHSAQQSCKCVDGRWQLTMNDDGQAAFPPCGTAGHKTIFEATNVDGCVPTDPAAWVKVRDDSNSSIEIAAVS